MGGSADRPATPAFLRASDAERDHVVDELRKEYVDGRLSHETFIFRMESALGARNHGQLAHLFNDLPPRRARLLARVKAALLGRRRRHDDEEPDAVVQVLPSRHGVPQPAYEPFGYSAAWSGAPGGSAEPPKPVPLVFPRGNGTVFSIGRTQDCDLRISDMSVSRHHAQLARGEDGWLLSDLGSHNGTRINGWLVREPVPLHPGDTVQFGSATFIVQDDERGHPRPQDGGERASGEPPRERGSGGLRGGGEPPRDRGDSGGSSPRASTPSTLLIWKP